MGGIGGKDGGGITGRSTLVGVRSVSSSSVDNCLDNGEAGGERVGKAGVAGIWKLRGETLSGDEDGEYMGDDGADGDGLELRRGDGVLGD